MSSAAVSPALSRAAEDLDHLRTNPQSPRSCLIAPRNDAHANERAAGRSAYEQRHALRELHPSIDEVDASSNEIPQFLTASQFPRLLAPW